MPRHARFGLLVAAVAIVAAGCSSSVGGTADFQKPTCSGDRAIKSTSFCFLLPSGFHKIEEGADGIFVGIDKNNAIDVRLDELGGDTSTLSDKELLDHFNDGFNKRSDSSYHLDTSGARIFYTAAGRGIGYDGTETVESGTAKLQENLIFHATSMMQVICASTDREKEVHSACVDILRSAQITDG